MTIERQNRLAAPTGDARAALEALFAPRAPLDVTPPPPPRSHAKIIVGQATPDASTGPRDAELQKRLRHLRAAEGAYAVTRVTKLLLAAGFSLPADQEIQRKLLEHSDEAQVRSALGVLTALLEREPPQRRTVLDARLRRLEENAEELPTRDLAAALRRKLVTGVLRS